MCTGQWDIIRLLTSRLSPGPTGRTGFGHRLYEVGTSSEEVCRHWFKARGACQASIYLSFYLSILITACSRHMPPHILPNLSHDICQAGSIDREALFSQMCCVSQAITYVWISLCIVRRSKNVFHCPGWHTLHVIVLFFGVIINKKSNQQFLAVNMYWWSCKSNPQGLKESQ